MTTDNIDLTKEFEDSDFGDVRLTSRLQKMANAAAAHPSMGIPQMMGDDAALEGTYRFLNNDKVNHEKILLPHIKMTTQRCSAHPTVLIVHDTTKFQFNGEMQRDGLGILPGGGQGFYGHFSLAVRPGEVRDVLGVVSIRTVFRHSKRGRRTAKQMRKDDKRESLRWIQAAEESGKLLRPYTRCIHVMDREGDSYEILSSLLNSNELFVVRLQNSRNVMTEDGQELKVRDITPICETKVQRTVQLSRRGKRIGSSQAKYYPSRKERTATLNISAACVKFIRGTRWDKSLPETLQLNIVDVTEVSPPEGQEPVQWRLCTTEPIDTVEQVLAVVDIYRSRWVIEEYFKSIKTGCAYEKRQFESKDALLNLLALFAVVGWRLFRLRSLARQDPKRKAREILTTVQLLLLSELSRTPLAKEPTVYEAFIAIAQLGGFLKRNGKPGWQTLGRGFETLLNLEMGWHLARKM